MNHVPWPEWLDIMQDPGILERRVKADKIRDNARIVEMTITMLQIAYRDSDSLEEALQNAIDSVRNVSAEMADDLEAIDRKPPKAPS